MNDPLCPQCGESPGADGLCPRCLLGAFLEMGDGESDAPCVVGERFGNYERMEPMGRGGMGVVWRARQWPLGRVVALKMIRGGHGESAAETLARFRAEEHALAALQHPHIIPIIEAGTAEGQLFYTMPLVEGGSLAGVLDGSGPAETASLRPVLTTPDGIASLIITAARAVHYAHSRGIIHRDLKPSNVLLDAAGVPHLIDFGVAKLTEQESALTITGAVVGTPAYMAPEQAAGGAAGVSTAADVYALGAILYELLTGRPPFTGSSPLEILRKVAETEPPAPSSLRRKVDRELETICLKCLDKNPARRYASAEALAEDLERWQRHEPVLARRTGRLLRIGKWSRRHPAGAALILLAFLAAGYFLRMRAVAESDLRREVAVTTAALDRAEAAERLAIENRYASDIRLAHTDMEAGRAGPARALLDGLQPTPGQPDLRGWEWRFLSQRAAGNQSRTLVPPGTARAMPALAFDGARRLLAAPAPGSTAGMWRWSIDSLECTALRPDMSYRIDLNLFLVKRGENVRDWARSAGIQEPAVSELETEAAERRGDKWGLVDSMSISANGEWLVTGGPHSQVRLWKWPDSRLHQALPVMEARVVFSPRGDWLAIAGRERATGRQSTWLLSFPKDQSLEAGRILPGGPWNLVAWDPAGEYLATASPTGEVAAWDAATLSRTPAWSMSPHACALAVFPGGQRLAVNPNGWRVLEMRRATDGRLESTLGEHSAAITAIALSRDGRRFATASQDNTVHVRESATGASIMRLEGHAGPVKALAWLSDENLATAGNDGTVRLWSVGGESGQFKKLPGLRNAEFSPDSARVAGIGNAGELLVTDPVTLKSRTLAACRT